jgi:SWI/SNF-related matrix-associated actin-dependent regulator of chromatin subfamily A member 5
VHLQQSQFRDSPYTTPQHRRETLKLSSERKTRQPRPPKQPFVHDHQFYPPRLYELLDKEKYVYWKLIQYVVSDADVEDPAERAALQEKVQSSTELTEEELDEKERLLKQGYNNWSRRDFTSFCKACEKYGRRDLESIAAELEGKTLKEVRDYSDTFWRRYKELSGWEKYIASIERGEAKLQKKGETVNALKRKMARYRQPFQQLKIAYSTNKGRHFTEEEDRFLVCMLYTLGVDTEDVHERLLREVRQAPQFRFDWFIKSRTAEELKKRCSQLLNLIEKEESDLAEMEKKKRKTKSNFTPKKSSEAAKKMVKRIK